MRNNSIKEFIAKLEEKLNMGNSTYLKLVKIIERMFVRQQKNNGTHKPLKF